MTFDDWKVLCNRVSGIAERIGRMRIDRAKRLAQSAGISPDGCCIHNAAMDTELRGWDFCQPGWYYDDMKAEALSQLNAIVQKTAHDLEVLR